MVASARLREKLGPYRRWMDISASAAETRLYRMTRIEAGDYLLPSNDLQTLWRITAYDEDDPLEERDPPVVRRIWGLSSRPYPKPGEHVDLADDFSGWEFISYGHRTRNDAVREAMS